MYYAEAQPLCAAAESQAERAAALWWAAGMGLVGLSVAALLAVTGTPAGHQANQAFRMSLPLGTGHGPLMPQPGPGSQGLMAVWTADRAEQDAGAPPTRSRWVWRGRGPAAGPRPRAERSALRDSASQDGTLLPSNGEPVQIDGADGLVVNVDVGQGSKARAAAPLLDDVADYLGPDAALDSAQEPWRPAVAAIGALRQLVAAVAVAFALAVVVVEGLARLPTRQKLSTHNAFSIL
eukprot:EG_transcript_9346